jgi:type II secretory pathway pseudopilin PulG
MMFRQRLRTQNHSTRIVFMRSERGFSYLTLMAMIVIIGISLAGASYQWKTVAKRENEKELLFRGNEYRTAIFQYMNLDPLKRYPHAMDDLIKDPRSPNGRKYLRKLYKDPVTGGDFVPIFDPAKGLIGVRSRSIDKPLKTSQFRVVNHCFEEKQAYREWLFVVEQPIPGQAVPQPAPPLNGMTPGINPLSTPPCPTADFTRDEQK